MDWNCGDEKMDKSKPEKIVENIIVDEFSFLVDEFGFSRVKVKSDRYVAIAKFACNLKKYGTPFFNGDFSLFPALDEIVIARVEEWKKQQGFNGVVDYE